MMNPYTRYSNYHSAMSSSNRGSGSSGWASSHHSSSSKPLIPKTNPPDDSPGPASASGSDTAPGSKTAEGPAPQPAPQPAPPPPPEPENERLSESTDSSTGGPLLGSMYPQVPPVLVLPKFPSKMQRWMDRYTYWKTARQLKRDQWVTLFVLLYPGNWRVPPELESNLDHNVALGIGWDEPLKPKHIIQAEGFLEKLTEEEARAMAEEDRTRAKRARREWVRQEEVRKKNDERIARDVMEFEMGGKEGSEEIREEGLEAIKEEDSEESSGKSLEDTNDEDWEDIREEENKDEEEEDEQGNESICWWVTAGKALETGDRCRCRFLFEHRAWQNEIPSVGKPLSRIAVARVKGFTLEQIQELLFSVPVNSADGGNAGWRWIFYVLRKLRDDISLGKINNNPDGPPPGSPPPGSPPPGGPPPPVDAPPPCYLELCPELMAPNQVTITGKLAVWENFLRNEGLIADDYQRRKLKAPKRNINFGLRRE